MTTALDLAERMGLVRRPAQLHAPLQHPRNDGGQGLPTPAASLLSFADGSVTRHDPIQHQEPTHVPVLRSERVV